LTDKKTVLVTGSNGFLGQTILKGLNESGSATKGTDISEHSKSKCEYKRADITNGNTFSKAAEGADTVIHTAGLAHVFSSYRDDYEKFWKINADGAENVANAAAKNGVQHFVLISTVAAYGPYTAGTYDENKSPMPVGPYAESKYEGELRAVEVAKRSGMALTILRLATLYGEGDPGNIKRLINSIDRRRFVWIGDGQNRKSLLYKGDAARACRAVALNPASGIRIFNISGPPCTMKEIVDTLCEALGKRPLPGKVPASIALPLSKVVSSMPIKRFKNIHGTVKKWLAEDVYDTSKFENTFGFNPEVGIEEGLRREVEWYRQTQSTDFAD